MRGAAELDYGWEMGGKLRGRRQSQETWKHVEETINIKKGHRNTDEEE